MVTVAYGPQFEKTIRKIRDYELKERVKTEIVKIVNNPSILKTPALQPKANKGSVYPPVQVVLSVQQTYRYPCLSLSHKDEQ